MMFTRCHNSRADLSIPLTAEEWGCALFEEVPVGMALFGKDFTFRQVNPALASMLRYTREELARLSLADIVPAENISELMLQTQRLFSDSLDRFELEQRCRRQDGTQLPVRLTMIALRDSEGQSCGLAMVEDISARVEAEAALRASEEAARLRLAELEATYAAAPVGLCVLDRELRWVRINAHLAEINGFPPEAHVGRTVRELLPDIAPSAEPLLRQVLDTGEPITGVELTGETPANPGVKRTWIENFFPLQDRSGSIIGINVVAEDITERIQAEQQIRREKAFAEVALDSLPGVFYVFNADKKLVRWNANFERVSGYTTAELASMDPQHFFGGKDREVIARAVQEVYARGEATAEAEFVAKNGQRTPYFFTGKLALLSDEPHLVGMGIDVSERRRLEAQLLQSQKMEGIGRLAGGIAHDFNNLLAVILGYAEMVESGLTEDSDLMPSLRHIQGAADRAATLTKQLLAFARRQATKSKIFDLNSLVAGMRDMLRPLIGASIQLETRLSPRLGWVQADAGQIEQVIVNLVVNARDAMPAGGTLLLETANVTLADAYLKRDVAVIPGEYVMLAVSDTGAGMPPEVQARLFEPFFSTKGLGKGTGLGLATCYGIVKQHKGYIWVYSEAGLGTTVKVYLPSMPPETSGIVPETTVANARGGQETVLVAEDEELIRQLAVGTLRKAGYTVLEAADGAEALRVAEAHPDTIHLLLSDMVMPNMRGGELAERLRQMRPNIRILFASGYSGEAFTAQGETLSAPLLPKPYSANALLEQVRKVLDAVSGSII